MLMSNLGGFMCCEVVHSSISSLISYQGRDGRPGIVWAEMSHKSEYVFRDNQ